MRKKFLAILLALASILGVATLGIDTAGALTGPTGWYNSKNGSIHVSLDSGNHLTVGYVAGFSGTEVTVFNAWIPNECASYSVNAGSPGSYQAQISFNGGYGPSGLPWKCHINNVNSTTVGWRVVQVNTTCGSELGVAYTYGSIQNWGGSGAYMSYIAGVCSSVLNVG